MTELSACKSATEALSALSTAVQEQKPKAVARRRRKLKIVFITEFLLR
jgi:hypothetical protein